MEKRISDEMLAKVEPEWREDMTKFVDTGEGRQEFLDHLDSGCGVCLAFVEDVFKKDSIAFQQLAKMLQEGRAEAKRKREEKLAKLGPLKRFWYRFLYFMELKND